MTEPGERIIADTPQFRLRQVNLQPGQQLTFEPNQQSRILSVVTGQLTDQATG